MLIGVGAAVGDGDFDAMVLTGVHHGVGVGKRSGEGLLTEDAPRSGLGCGDGHGRMAVNCAWTDIYQIKVLAV